MNTIKNVLGTNAFFITNKKIAKKVLHEASFLLNELIEEFSYFKENNLLINDDYFYSTSEKLEERTFLSYKKQKKAIQKLEEVGFIEKKLMGVPARLHFRILEDNIWEFLNSEDKTIKKGNTSIAEKAKLDMPKRQNIIYVNKENNINKTNKKIKEEKNDFSEILEEKPAKKLPTGYEEIFYLIISRYKIKDTNKFLALHSQISKFLFKQKANKINPNELLKIFITYFDNTDRKFYYSIENLLNDEAPKIFSKNWLAEKEDELSFKNGFIVNGTGIIQEKETQELHIKLEKFKNENWVKIATHYPKNVSRTNYEPFLRFYKHFAKIENGIIPRFEKIKDFDAIKEFLNFI